MRSGRSTGRGGGTRSSNGSIAKRPDGRWEVRITLAGRRRSFYGATQREALAKRDKARADAAQGIDAVAGRETVGAYLAGWIEGVRPSLRPGTFRRYSDFVRLHVADIARIRLADVSGHDLQWLYTRRLGAGLAPATVRQLHAVLRKAFADAVRRRILGRNPAEGATPPRAPRKEMRVLSPEEARAFLAAAASDRLSALFVLPPHGLVGAFHIVPCAIDGSLHWRA